MKKIGVAKFGGSSVADEKAMYNCAEIIKEAGHYKMIIVSATANTTNQLEEIATLSISSISCAKDFFEEQIFKRHIEIAHRLDVLNLVKSQLEYLRNEAFHLIENQQLRKLCDMDQFYSIGERLSATIFGHFLNIYLDADKVLFLDARDIIKTDKDFSKATPLIKEISSSYENLNLCEKTIFVTSGFIGSSLDGYTTTLGREGSDFSASLFAEAMNADFIDIWTDVEGIASMDPRKNSGARYIKKLPYESASYLAYGGAKVLFPRTVEPAKRSSIEIRIKSSLKKNTKGTVVCAESLSGFCFYGISINNEESLDGDVICVVGNNLIQIFNDMNLLYKKKKLNYMKDKSHDEALYFKTQSRDSQELLLILHDEFIKIPSDVFYA